MDDFCNNTYMFIYREVGTIIRSLGCCPSEAEILDMLAEVGSMLDSHHSMLDSHHSMLDLHHSMLDVHHSMLDSHHSMLDVHHSMLDSHHSMLDSKNDPKKMLIEPPHGKNQQCGFRTGLTQTGLYRHRSWLEA